MLKSKLKTLAISAALAALLSVPALAVSNGGAVVNADSLNLRSQPTTASQAVKQLPRGTCLVVSERVNDGWYKVVCNSVLGYVSADYVTYYWDLLGELGYGTIYGSDVRLRQAPSLDSAIVGVYADGTWMHILGVYGNWYKVETGEAVGFVYSEYFSLCGLSARDSAAPTPPANTAMGQRIVDTAMQYQGVPYVWGGTSPEGFDCSGLVHYCYAENGYAINRTAASIFENGSYVAYSDLQVGDAVCFNNGSDYIGHTGIYIGEGKFVHASSSLGYVTVTDLTSGYYNTHFAGGRRIVQ